MSAGVDSFKCDGCPHAREAPCTRVCPGDLLVRNGNRVNIPNPENCWSCAACVKACPRGALFLERPEEVGGQGARLFARARRGATSWMVISSSGKIENFTIPAVTKGK